MKTQPTLPPDPDSKGRGSGQTCKQPGLCRSHPRVSGSAAEEPPEMAEGQAEAGAGLSHRWKHLRADEARYFNCATKLPSIKGVSCNTIISKNYSK